MSGNASRPIRSVHCFQSQLEEAGSAGATVLDLLEIQSSNYYSETPKDSAKVRAWEASKKVLDIKLTDQCAYPLDAFKELKEVAETGPNAPVSGSVLYAVLTVADSFSPETAPLRIACTVHLGGPVPWEIQSETNCYELIEHAVNLFGTRRHAQPGACEGLHFLFHGELFHMAVEAFQGDKALLTIFDDRDFQRAQALV
jgi:hypothetical protein